MLTYFRINYLTNLTYFPIFPHYVNFSKVAAASPLAAAVDRTTINPQSSILNPPNCRESGGYVNCFV